MAESGSKDNKTCAACGNKVFYDGSFFRWFHFDPYGASKHCPMTEEDDLLLTPAAKGYKSGFEGLPAVSSNPYLMLRDDKSISLAKKYHEGWRLGSMVRRSNLLATPVFIQDGLDFLEDERG